MEKSPDAFRTISEVAEELALPQHVLRFWETRFTQIKPLKRGGGRRYYRPDDVALVRAIKHLLYGEGYTIKGVQRILKEQGLQAVIAAARAGGGEAVAQPPLPGDGLIDDDIAALPLNEAGHAEGGMAGQDDADAQTLAQTGYALSPGDIGLLQAALAELDECSRLLASARA